MTSDKNELGDRVFPAAQRQSTGKIEHERSSVAGSSESEEEDEYTDIEDDFENVKIISLFDDVVFNDVSSMLAYVQSTYHFDLASVQKQFGLDLLGMIKLVNFVRSEVKEGRGQIIDTSDKAIFDQDCYLQPVLEDDALLYSLEDIIENGTSQGQDAKTSVSIPSGIEQGSEAYSTISELRHALLETQKEVLATQQRLELAEIALSAARDIDSKSSSQERSKSCKPLSHSKYEGNYDGTELHRTMIADKARTEAYRDFILHNPQIFKDKAVLDLGCGTGILSLFCADAGAKVVYAVDQSGEIINKAREIVFRNRKQDIIKFIHGRIQDVQLPVQRVDIIVSEWMGYCLLFEAMFDSVIWARDRYLVPGGLMVPAQSTLYIAPFCNPGYRLSRIDFWDDVYGYDMGCLKPDVLKTIDVDSSLDSTHLVSAKQAFRSFNHYAANVADLSFRNVPFSFHLTRDIPGELDGFAIWFDVTFDAPHSSSCTPFSPLTLSTGPEDTPTHWHQALCLIDQKGQSAGMGLPRGLKFDGEISFEKEGTNKEGLDIAISWQSDVSEKGTQEWLLR